MINMNKKGFSAKAASLMFAAVAFLTGFLLIDRGSVSGNVIVRSGSSIGTISIIGLLLIFGAVALAARGMKR